MVYYFYSPMKQCAEALHNDYPFYKISYKDQYLLHALQEIKLTSQPGKEDIFTVRPHIAAAPLFDE